VGFEPTRFVLDNLNTVGWVLIILGVIQLTGGFSLMAGNTYGRVIGIVGGSLGAIGALLSIGQGNPWWSLAVFFLCIHVVSESSCSARTSGLPESEVTVAGTAGVPAAPATSPSR
jgi:hypothetical protein